MRERQQIPARGGVRVRPVRMAASVSHARMLIVEGFEDRQARLQTRNSVALVE